MPKYPSSITFFSALNTVLVIFLIISVSLTQATSVPPEVLLLREQQKIDQKAKYISAYEECAKDPLMSARLYCNEYAKRISEGK